MARILHTDIEISTARAMHTSNDEASGFVTAYHAEVLHTDMDLPKTACDE